MQNEINDFPDTPLQNPPPIQTIPSEIKEKLITADSITPAIPTHEMGEITVIHPEGIENPYVNDDTPYN